MIDYTRNRIRFEVGQIVVAEGQHGRPAVIETKAREPRLAFPEDHPVEHLPEPVVELTPQQIAALAEAEERDRQRQLEWDTIIEALNNNSMAVFRAMRRFQRSKHRWS